MPKLASTHLARILWLGCILGVLAASAARAAVSRDAMVVSPSADGEPGAPVEPSTGDSPNESDLFLGTYSKRIAIPVPPNVSAAATPKIELVYRSRNGNGWLGMGWALDFGAIERNSRRKVDYAVDDYVLNTGGTAAELVKLDPNREVYQQKIEFDFKRIEKMGSGGDGRPFWVVTDKLGVRYRYGYDASSRQDDPADPKRVFKWCLDQVVDPNGNQYTIRYYKDAGAIYPELINYAGVVVVQFWRGDGSVRPDAVTSYRTGFSVQQRYLLKAIQVSSPSGTGPELRTVRAFQLDYRPSASTGRELLRTLQQFGRDSTVVAGQVTGSALAAETFTWSEKTWASGESAWSKAAWTGPTNAGTKRVDLDGDGRIDWLPKEAGQKSYLSKPSGPVSGEEFDLPEGAGTPKEGLMVVDLDGDGRPDLVQAHLDSATGRNVSKAWRNVGGGCGRPGCAWSPADEIAPPDVAFTKLIGTNWLDEGFRFADLDGDGLPDLLQGLYVGSTNTFTANAWRNTGHGWEVAPAFNPPDALVARDNPAPDGFDPGARLVDLDGDKRIDFVVALNSAGSPARRAWRNNGGNCTTPGCAWIESEAYRPPPPIDIVYRDGGYWRGREVGTRFVDVNGDGLPDIVAGYMDNWKYYSEAFLNTGSGWVSAPEYAPPEVFAFWMPGHIPNTPGGGSETNDSGMRISDVNGDGLPDLVQGLDNAKPPSARSDDTDGLSVAWMAWVNGNRDCSGKSCRWVPAAQFTPPARFAYWYGVTWKYEGAVFHGYRGDATDLAIGGDVNADGLPDIEGSDGAWLNTSPAPDLLVGISNGIGGSVRIDYDLADVPANNAHRHVRVVSKITTTDSWGSGSAETRIAYSDPYLYAPNSSTEEFRGFGKATVTEPKGPSGEQREVRYWFYQGDANSPSAPIGYMKGKLNRREVWDLQRLTYTYTTLAYEPPGQVDGPTYFTPLSEILNRNCVDREGATQCNGASDTGYGEYDAWGNPRLIIEFADGDWRTIVREYSTSSPAGIVGLKTSETVYAGLRGTGEPPIARTNYYYDGQLDLGTCFSAGLSVAPTRGNLTKIVRWLDHGDSPEEWLGYDNEGRMVCRLDPDRNRTSYSYAYAFRTSETNAKGHVVRRKYYGVDVAPDKGHFGQLQSTIDANGAETQYEYDAFGRLTRRVQVALSGVLAGEPFPGFETTWTYFIPRNDGNFVETKTSGGKTLWEALDGFGRVQAHTEYGSDAAAARAFDTITAFNPTGTVRVRSVPFDRVGDSHPRYTAYTYDAAARVTSTTFPTQPNGTPMDGATTSVTCYDDVARATVFVDANGHRKRMVRDARGNIIRVHEYRGVYSSCTTEEGSPYATTQYTYDALNRLTMVTDAKGTPFIADYDTVGRRVHLYDPNLGNWYFGYTPGGDVLWQQDANGQSGDLPKSYKTWFAYDELHRVTMRHRVTGRGVELGSRESFYYDEPNIPYSKGKRTRMEDASGVTMYSYDAIGRLFLTDRKIGETTYRSRVGFDAAGRVDREWYPMPVMEFPGSRATYDYDSDGFLWKVNVDGTTFATLSSYNALGEPGSVAFGNQIQTSYAYDTNSRVETIRTKGPGGPIVDLTYGYDNVANVLTIKDGVASSESKAYGYDELDRLVWSRGGASDVLPTPRTFAYDPIRVHAIASTSDGRSFSYDPNGNTLSDGVRSMEYDGSNRATSVAKGAAVTRFTYDAEGRRVTKEVTSGGVTATTTYLGRLSTCTAAGCERHVFARRLRLATIAPDGSVRYYHPDVLGSTLATTGRDGKITERMHYAPYGGESSTIGARFRFTGKEADPETGLYYYDARYYDPEIGRFITADVFVSGVYDPQNLNRYRYVRNNPCKYTDPTGHFAAAIPYIQRAAEWCQAGGCQVLADAALAAAVAVSVWAVGKVASEATLLPDSAWDKMAPDFGPAGQTIDTYRFNPKTGELEKSKQKYDEFGRPEVRTDYTDHGTPQWHDKPHHEKTKYGPGKVEGEPQGNEPGPAEGHPDTFTPESEPAEWTRSGGWAEYTDWNGSGDSSADYGNGSDYGNGGDYGNGDDYEDEDLGTFDP